MNRKSRQKTSSASKPRAKKQKVPRARPEDVASIDSIIGALYALISFREGEKSDWKRLSSLFFPSTRIVYKRPDGVVESVDVKTFISNSQKIIKKNKLKAFDERELARVVDVFGSIAHAFSTYESRFSETDIVPLARGINSIQLLHDKGRWWVVSIFWVDERTEGAMPTAYLGGRS